MTGERAEILSSFFFASDQKVTFPDNYCNIFVS